MATNYRLGFAQYKGSDEETYLKQSLKWLATAVNSPPPGFFNLVIKYSNALLGTSFSDASVFLQVTEDRLRKNYSEDGRLKCGLVKMNSVLNLPIIEKFVANGVDAIEKYNDSEQKAFLSLMEFLRERKTHEKALKQISGNGSKETQVMAVLAHHLFSQLVPDRIYEVDNHANQVPKTCCCGCNAKICEGNTSVGSPGTWHGRADIFLNHAIAVAILKPQMVSKDEEEEDSDEDEDESEPKRKQRKVESENKDENERESERNSRVHNKALLGQTVLQQILAQAVTNGFAQVHLNENLLSHFLIPTFGATSEHVTICLYDPENDYLLHIKEQLKLWRDFPNGQSEIRVDTIVIIWLFLNFTVFTRKGLHSFINLKKSGLHRDLEQCLQFYKKAETRVNVNLPLVPVFEDIDSAVLS